MGCNEQPFFFFLMKDRTQSGLWSDAYDIHMNLREFQGAQWKSWDLDARQKIVRLQTCFCESRPVGRNWCSGGDKSERHLLGNVKVMGEILYIYINNINGFIIHHPALWVRRCVQLWVYNSCPLSPSYMRYITHTFHENRKVLTLK